VSRIRRQQIHPRLVYVEDHARALLAVVQRGRPGETYVIGGDAEARDIDIVQRICAILNARRPDAAPHARLMAFPSGGRVAGLGPPEAGASPRSRHDHP
jgi:dTDP-D-glucose 4,6-dehydratase